MQVWGVDGCKSGWFYFRLDEKASEFGVTESLTDLVKLTSPGPTILIDIPIGLRSEGSTERLCDLEARRALGPGRASSVFPAPCRDAIHADSYEEVSRLNKARLGRKLSKQTWAITPKIREVDSLLQHHPMARSRLRETHPELCFRGLAGTPMHHSKKTREGFRERLAVLANWVPDASDRVAEEFLEYGGFEAQRGDIVDALVAAVCAMRIDQCVTLPATPERDATGLPMEMVCLPE